MAVLWLVNYWSVLCWRSSSEDYKSLTVLEGFCFANTFRRSRPSGGAEAFVQRYLGRMACHSPTEQSWSLLIPHLSSVDSFLQPTSSTVANECILKHHQIVMNTGAALHSKWTQMGTWSSTVSYHADVGAIGVARKDFRGFEISRGLSNDFEHIFMHFYNRNGFILGCLNPETP